MSALNKVLLKVDRISSTQSFLQGLKSYLPDTTVLSVESQAQFAGRGQRDKTWQNVEDEPICFSLSIRQLRLALEQAFDLHIVVTLSIIETLESLHPELKIAIKWPNDLMLNDKKVGGILIHNAFQGSHLTEVIIGIGINRMISPYRAEKNAFSSLADHVQGSVLPAKIYVKAIQKRILDVMNDFKDLEINPLCEKYNTYLWRKEEIIHVIHKHEDLFPVLYGVSRDGLLVVKQNQEFMNMSYSNTRWLQS